jgi:uncharacterized membrane protein YkvA (DUF1232 family)
VDAAPEVMFGPFGLVDDAALLVFAVRGVVKALASRWRLRSNPA